MLTNFYDEILLKRLDESQRIFFRDTQSRAKRYVEGVMCNRSCDLEHWKVETMSIDRTRRNKRGMILLVINLVRVRSLNRDQIWMELRTSFVNMPLLWMNNQIIDSTYISDIHCIRSTFEFMQPSIPARALLRWLRRVEC